LQGIVLIKTADELMNFSRGEENLLEEQIKALAESGVDVIVAGAKFGDMALHYINKYKMMAVRLNSKWDVRRLCKAVGATALPRLVRIAFFLFALYLLSCSEVMTQNGTESQS
jgi:T-complex protein 1 subunit theta